MKRFILTGAPGAGKTVILRQLELDGFDVVEEAASDLIALWQAGGVQEPWREPTFVEAIADLQHQRLMRTSGRPAEAQFHDRSAICTIALARHLNRRLGPILEREVARIASTNAFEKAVFFIRGLGFVTPTAARRISHDEAVQFEAIHEAAYRAFGYELIDVPAAPVVERARSVAAIAAGA